MNYKKFRYQCTRFGARGKLFRSARLLLTVCAPPACSAHRAVWTSPPRCLHTPRVVCVPPASSVRTWRHTRRPHAARILRTPAAPSARPPRRLHAHAGCITRGGCMPPVSTLLPHRPRALHARLAICTLAMPFSGHPRRLHVTRDICTSHPAPSAHPAPSSPYASSAHPPCQVIGGSLRRLAAAAQEIEAVARGVENEPAHTHWSVRRQCRAAACVAAAPDVENEPAGRRKAAAAGVEQGGGHPHMLKGVCGNAGWGDAQAAAGKACKGQGQCAEGVGDV
ncbi:hypothetical protein GGX14DRAFT_565953 [Mycena pura]|uniref:Uncharacterized protein n=1 Tax=Mycena pura TaxID=153505 RepID=A0AAD6YD79_9AGAR|nr:hypothetical protein GGX14DRAFT_565953 [Mycena pura]